MAEYPDENIELNERPNREEEAMEEEEEDQQNDDEETSFVESLISPIFSIGNLLKGTEVNIFSDHPQEFTTIQETNAKKSVLKDVFQFTPNEKYGPFNQDLLHRVRLRRGLKGRINGLEFKTNDGWFTPIKARWGR